MTLSKSINFSEVHSSHQLREFLWGIYRVIILYNSHNSLCSGHNLNTRSKKSSVSEWTNVKACIHCRENRGFLHNVVTGWKGKALFESIKQKPETEVCRFKIVWLKLLLKFNKMAAQPKNMHVCVCRYPWTYRHSYCRGHLRFPAHILTIFSIILENSLFPFLGRPIAPPISGNMAWVGGHPCSWRCITELAHPLS